MKFLSTLSLRRATSGAAAPAPGAEISIHALLAESDAPAMRETNGGRNFYPRSPCGERQASQDFLNDLYEFLSTLSLRRATAIGRRGRAARGNFYPRSPCGERLTARIIDPTYGKISIHALLAESDAAMGKPTFEIAYFYPRSPCGERLP